MNIGELFVNLGIKGSDKTIGAISGVQKGLKDTASTALETKVAIVGALYALERFFSASGQRGTDLTNFNALLGVSTKTLQQYQYAARQVGVSNQEVEGTFKALQSSMTKTLMGEGAPKGMAQVAQLTGGITPADIKKFAEQPQLLLQRLQEYAQKESNSGLRNEVLKSFGVGDSMSAALNRKAFRPEVLKKAPTYSEKEIQSLDRANIAWSNLGNKIEMAVGHFNAMHGGKLVQDISKTSDSVLKMAEAFIKLSDTVKLFQKISDVFEGWAHAFDAITAGAKALSDIIKNTNSLDQEKNKLGDTVDKTLGDVKTGNISGLAQDLTPDFSWSKQVATDLFSSIKAGFLGQKPPAIKTGTPQKPISTAPTTEPFKLRLMPSPGVNQSVAPKVSPYPVSPAAPAEGQKIEVNQTLNFQHDGKDAKKTGASTEKAVRDAFRQLPSQGQGS